VVLWDVSWLCALQVGCLSILAVAASVFNLNTTAVTVRCHVGGGCAQASSS
jgi:hypothetical protein